MSEDKVNKQTDVGRDSPDNTVQQSRRRLLKNSVAIPVIMTLSSGAAHAVTSNLVSAATTGDVAKEDGKVMCFDVVEEVVYVDGGYTKYDLGDAVTYTLEENEQACVTREDMIRGPGIVISSTAYLSISERLGMEKLM
ncbi:MAG: hypothetical protein KIT59_12280 [Nitrosomonas sp.]|nr:hypothetical protein [Nitrosomonas sp.]